MIIKPCRHILSILLMATLFFSLVAAKRAYRSAPCKVPQMTSVHLVDRNGFTETISNKERIKQYQNIDFLKPQSYQKALRIYERDQQGRACSVVTSYYPNGNIKQYLDIVNARAFGTYAEWHSNGQSSILTTVIGGSADITAEAEKTWIYDGISYVWNEKGDLIAEIQYSQGDLDGLSTYYHSSGKVWKLVPYEKGKISGEEKIYLESGDVFQQTTYHCGVKHGCSQRFWSNKQLAAQEDYRQGRLESGQYYDSCGTLISEVIQGFGYRAVFGKEDLGELQEYKKGLLDGEVKVFGKDRRLVRLYHSKDGLNHGEEIDYYDSSQGSPLPKLSVQWRQGKVHGTMKSWFSNGALESQREMINNTKTGVLTSWYLDGSLMMIEEYDQDKLVRGDYFRQGEKVPVSQVQDGKGVAMIYDAEGLFIQKATYERGKPKKE